MGTETDLFVATRDDRSLRFTGEKKLTLSSASTDNHPTVTPNGLTVFFARSDGTEWAIYSSTRPTTTADFQTPMKVGAPLDGGTSELQPFVLDNPLYYTTFNTVMGTDLMMHRASMTSSGLGTPSPAPGALVREGGVQPHRHARRAHDLLLLESTGR